jgi:hypothetical protein
MGSRINVDKYKFNEQWGIDVACALEHELSTDLARRACEVYLRTLPRDHFLCLAALAISPALPLLGPSISLVFSIAHVRSNPG